MKRRWMISGAVALLYVVCVNATNDPPAYAYQGPSKQAWVALGLHHISHPCSYEMETEYGTVGTSLPTDRCFRMSGRERMHGVWIDEFEGSRFLPGERDASQAEVGSGGVWLDVETNRIPELFKKSPVEGLRAFEIEFIGRQTAVAGQHGHMGGSDHEIIVDRLISARPVDVAPYAQKLNLWWQRQREKAN